MTVYIGADHRGFKLKESLKQKLEKTGYQVEDAGNKVYDTDDDFVDFVDKVSRGVNKGGKGILICGTGVGMDMAANKYRGVRAGLVFDAKQARQAREDDNINIAILAADFINEESAWEIIEVFLAAVFMPTEKHVRRLEKIKLIETKND